MRRTQPRTRSRYIREWELELFQECPQKLHLYRDSEYELPITEGEFLQRMMHDTLRWMWTVAVRDGTWPSHKALKARWANIVTKEAFHNSLGADATREILADGAISIGLIRSDVEDQGLAPVSGKTPMVFLSGKRALITEPEAICVDAQQRAVMVNYTRNHLVKTLTNSLVYRARLLACAKSLAHTNEVILRNYSLACGTQKEYTSRTLCTEQLETDVTNAIVAISDGYAAPSTCCVGDCPYLTGCYY